MKDRIKLLPNKVANQIAAGEVVTHPASVIKEMMENAMDAGATEVVVNYRRSGYDLIQIIDNGCGMTPRDARLAFDRHATSKIRSAKDIYSLNTFGFRGEALASIAAVARIELRTCTEESEMGTVTVVDSGEFKEQREDHCRVGSEFLVTEIFQSIPARRRFLEKDSRSASNIKSEFRRVVLCRPELSFELYGDDAPIYRLAPTTLAGRIVDVVGRGIKKSLLEVKTDTVIVKINGYIGHPDSAKKSNHDQYMFANGRYFESSSLYRAVLKGYDKILKGDRPNPSYFLYFEVEPDNLDVNIHPQKTEVRFAEESAIWTILVAAVREALARTGVIPMMEFDQSSSIEIPVAQKGVVYAEPSAVSNAAYNPFEAEQSIDIVIPSDDSEMAAGGASSSIEYDFIDSLEPVESYRPTVEYEAIPSTYSEKSPAQKSSKSSHSALGRMEGMSGEWESGFEIFESRHEYTPHSHVESLKTAADATLPSSSTMSWDNIDYEPDSKVELPLEDNTPHSDSIDINDITITHGTYGWCKVGTNMTVIDLRRAKERLLYDHYYKSLSTGEMVSQHILFPIEMVLSREEFAQVESNIAEFSATGFGLKLHDDCRVEIVGLPADITTEMAEGVIYELLHLLSTPESALEQRRERVASVMAHNGAMSLSRNLSSQQAKEIISQLLHNGCATHTASGKEIIWSVGRDDIKRKLK